MRMGDGGSSLRQQTPGPAQGFTTRSFSPWKRLTLRVAMIARRARKMPAIWVSRKSTGLPCRRGRGAAPAAAGVA